MHGRCRRRHLDSAGHVSWIRRSRAALPGLDPQPRRTTWTVPRLSILCVEAIVIWTGSCSSVLVSRLLPTLALPQIGLGSLKVILAVAGMAFPRPLLFGGPVGPRRGPTTLQEKGGDCSVCELVPRTGYLIACDVTTQESARKGSQRERT